MKKRKTAIAVFMVLILLTSVGFVKQATADTKTWTSVWSTSMVDATVKDVIEYKKGSFVSSVINLKNNTARMALKVNGSGEKIRLVLSNDFGEAAQPIQSISVGKTNTSDTRQIVKNTRKQVYVNGKKSFSIPAGERITTDEVALSVTAGEMITVSIYYGNREPDTIGLYGADSYTHITPSNFAERDDFGTFGLTGEQLYSDDSNATGHYDLIPSLCEVDVYGDQLDGCIVVFGDSTVTNEIPNYLAENLRANGITNLSVTQAAIKGNRLTADGAGAEAKFIGINGIDRFKRDVLSQANVKYVIVKLGDNDIIHPYCEGMEDAHKTNIYEMQDCYRYLNCMARENGIEYYICEIAPWKGYTRENSVNWSLEIDQLRLDVNKWIMEEHSADCKFFMDCITDGYAVKNEDTTDGAHYTEKGQRKLAKLFQCAFTQELVDID